MLGAGGKVIMMMKQGIAGIAVVALMALIADEVGVQSLVYVHLHLQTGAGAHIVDRWA